MTELLRNSVSVSVTSNCQGCFFNVRADCTHSSRRYGDCLFHALSIKPNKSKWRAIGARGVSMLYAFSKENDLIVLSNMVARVEPELDLINGEENDMEKEDEGLDSLAESLPPWGNVEVNGECDIELNRDIQPLQVLNKKLKKGFEGRIRVHYLEERNEEMLSRRILILSRSNKLRSALELFESMRFLSLRPNLHACNSLLSCLLRNQLLDDALRVFGFMRASEITSGHSYSLILKAIANERGIDSAIDMFVEFGGYSRAKKDFDVIVYNTMISICGRVNDWIEVEKLWKSMKENGHKGTRVTYSLLVCIFVRCNQNELAFDAYYEMIENELKPGDDVMQAVIGLCTKEGKWELALNLFQCMLEGKSKPNHICCNALINTLAKAGKVELAFKVYDAMKSFGHTPDTYTWNALLTALYNANQHADALQLFEGLKQDQNSQLNVQLYNTALMSCQKLSLWDKALQLLWQMEASGLAVPTSSYNLVISACEVARKPKVALQVYEHMVHQKCSPDTFTHLALIRSCIWGSLWANVDEILEVTCHADFGVTKDFMGFTQLASNILMTRTLAYNITTCLTFSSLFDMQNVAPDASLYNAAIQGMCLRRKYKSAKKLYLKMRELDFQPDGKTRALMLQNFQKDSS